MVRASAEQMRGLELAPQSPWCPSYNAKLRRQRRGSPRDTLPSETSRICKLQLCKTLPLIKEDPDINMYMHTIPPSHVHPYI